LRLTGRRRGDVRFGSISDTGPVGLHVSLPPETGLCAEKDFGNFAEFNACVGRRSENKSGQRFAPRVALPPSCLSSLCPHPGLMFGSHGFPRGGGVGPWGHGRRHERRPVLHVPWHHPLLRSGPSLSTRTGRSFRPTSAVWIRLRSNSLPIAAARSSLRIPLA